MARFLPRSLGGRIALVGGGFALLTCLLGLLTYYVVHEAIEKHLDDRIMAEAEALLAAGGPQGLVGVIEVVRSREGTHTAGDLGYIVLDAKGRRVAGTLDAPVPPPGYSEFLHYRLADGTRGIAQTFNLPISGGGRLVVAADRSEIDQMDNIIIAMFGVATALILLVGFGSVIALRRAVSRRLALMGATAGAIMAGDLSRRMPLAGDAEFDQVAEVINRMLERIEALLENVRQLSTDLAHDIRSPLNRVRGSLEKVAGGAGGEAPEQAAVTAIGEIDDLLELLGGILGISEIEGFAVRKRFVPLDWSQLAADVVDGYRPAVEAADKRITFEGRQADVLGDAALLRRCLANLIDNALLHAAGASWIHVRIGREDGRCILTVGDNGPGIPAEAHETVFRRFVRLDRSRSTPGHGLGLNMVAAILHAHHGTAEVRPTPTGLTVALSMPCASAGASTEAAQ